MSEETITLQLKEDQIFGLHVNVPAPNVDAVCAALDKHLLEFSRAWPTTERLHESGRTTLLLFDTVKDVRCALSDPATGVRIADHIESLAPRYEAPFAKLLEIGRPHADRRDPAGSAEAKAWAFTEADVPDLLRMMSDDELHGASAESGAVWAPIHAIGALGGLRAESAIEPLLAEWRRLERHEDDYLGDEVSRALAAIGPASAVPVAAVLADETRAEGVRSYAAETLAQLAKNHSEARGSCLAALVAQLMAHPMQTPEFNGFLVSALLNAGAKEAAEHLERAFASGRVDESIAGDWEDVQIELGLKLQREHPPKPNEWTARRAELRDAFGMPDPAADDFDDFSPAALPVTPLPQPYRAPLKVGRNEPCPCGSGKKYKKCCGA